MHQSKTKQQTKLSLVELVAQKMLDKISLNEYSNGTKLPSVRKLAEELEISSETAFRAYDKLVASGHIEARRGSGFYVKRTTTKHNSPKWQTKYFRENAGNWEKQLEPFKPYHNDLGSGHFPEEWIMQSEIAAAIRSISQINPSYLSQYQDVYGYMPLRQQLCLKLEEQGINVQPYNIMLTSGATDAIHLTIWSHFFPQQYLMREMPSPYIHTQRMLARGVEILEVPRGADGPDTDTIESLCKKYKPKAFFCSSILQNPTSSNITPHVAYKILKLAEEYDFIVVDDDTYGDLMPLGRNSSITRLATMDQLNRVIQIGSFSKTIAPGLRVGYIAASPQRISHISLYKSVGAISSSQINERIVYRLISEGKYRHHCEQIRLRLDERREIARNRLKDIGCEVLPTTAGMYLWAKIPDKFDVNDIETELLKQNIRIAPGTLFASSSGNAASKNHIRFSIAATATSPKLDILAAILNK